MLAALMSFRQSRARLLLSLRSTWASKLLSRTYSNRCRQSQLDAAVRQCRWQHQGAALTPTAQHSLYCQGP